MTQNTPPCPIIFVGGAPRSGTTVTHALLCTSAHSNVYHPEVAFIRPLVESYALGMATWQSHTAAFFAEPEHLRIHLSHIVTWAFNHVAAVLKNPDVLCVKDPMMSPIFPELRQLLGDRIRFVTVVRHPYDVLRSRQEVIERAGEPFDARVVGVIAQEYMNFYTHLDADLLRGALLPLRYEDLDKPETIDRLGAFCGLPDLAPEKVWAESRDQSGVDQSPWTSPKYHSPIDTRSRFEPLADQWCAIVDEICGPMMDRFGYARRTA
ncbi:sulfotransferase family protein [Plastorhodobacter daqingensis]|uniref:Sulfotransferase family protein n=1 Tax=Plastorhodobacter daqingensis TaxID=1387281 RepID=A0ABW2UMK4_9RHOB